MEQPIIEISAGGVVYRGEPGRRQVLLIQDRHRRWCLPKGGVEAGETIEEAALREIEEETGIIGRIEAPLGESRYTYRDHRGTINKTVYYYLVAAVDGKIRPQRSELLDARWFSTARALQQFGYANTRHILLEALTRL